MKNADIVVIHLAEEKCVPFGSQKVKRNTRKAQKKIFFFSERDSLCLNKNKEIIAQPKLGVNDLVILYRTYPCLCGMVNT